MRDRVRLLESASPCSARIVTQKVSRLGRVYREGYDYRKAGVMLSGLGPVAPATGRLFSDRQLERFRLVMPVIDRPNKKYGRDTLRLAGANPKGGRRTQAAKRSLRYTTKLAEVLLID